MSELRDLENEVLFKAEAWYDDLLGNVPANPTDLALYDAVGSLRIERQRRIRQIINRHDELNREQ